MIRPHTHTHSYLLAHTLKLKSVHISQYIFTFRDPNFGTTELLWPRKSSEFPREAALSPRSAVRVSNQFKVTDECDCTVVPPQRWILQQEHASPSRKANPGGHEMERRDLFISRQRTAKFEGVVSVALTAVQVLSAYGRRVCGMWRS